MIYGILPVGGRSSRLGLPFSKELLPLKSKDCYRPLCSFIIDKMFESGVNKIIFIHGLEFKRDILSEFQGGKFLHYKQKELGFGRVLWEVINVIPESDHLGITNIILLGLPDAIYTNCPIKQMLQSSSDITCGLFKTTDKNLRVDRLRKDRKFDIKTIKTKENTNYFWGIIKFKINILTKIMSLPTIPEEVGDILNKHIDKINFVKGGNFLDLGTWNNWIKYNEDWH